MAMQVGDAGLGARSALVGDVDGGRRVVAHEHGREPGDDTRLGGEGGDVARDLRPHLPGDRSAVDQHGGHDGRGC